MVCEEAVDLIREFEGTHRMIGPDLVAPYLDPVGIPTIGTGSIWYLDGRRVTMESPPISLAQCEELLQRELRHSCEPAIDRLINVRLHPFMRGSLASWTYNLGGGNLQASTLRKVINARQWSLVPGELAKWRVAKGKILSGLVRRRAAEAELFMRGVAAMRAEAADNDNGGWQTTIIFPRAA